MRETEPTSMTQGEQVVWTKNLTDYPADLYTLVYRFRGPDVGFNVTATASGSDHLATIEASVTLTKQPGKWRWQAWLTEVADALHTFQFAAGDMSLLAGFDAASLSGRDLRSEAAITLDVIRAAIRGTATANHRGYEISTPAGSRRIDRMSMADLLLAEKHYASIVAREKAAARVQAGGGFGRSVKVRMFEQ